MKICDKSAPLKITLIENYALDAQQSMLKFGELMAELLVEHGVAVDRLAPQAFLGKSILARRGLAKWLGYIDKYLIFPFQLAKYVKKKPRACLSYCRSFQRRLREVPEGMSVGDHLS